MVQASLLSLPYDLRQIILEKLFVPESGPPHTRDLNKLCLVCQKLLPQTQKLLYSEFWSDKGKDVWRIQPFLITIASKRHLAEHVRKLSFVPYRASEPTTNDFDDLDYDLHRKTRKQIKRDVDENKSIAKAIENLDFAETRFHIRGARNGVDEIIIALLILLAPNLKELELWAPPMSGLLEKILYHAITTCPAGIRGPQQPHLQRFFRETKLADKVPKLRSLERSSIIQGSRMFREILASSCYTSTGGLSKRLTVLITLISF